MQQHARWLLSAIFLIASVLCFQSRSQAYDVVLEWDPNVEDNLGGYIVYYGTKSLDYQHSVDVGDNTSCIISGLDPAITYFFAVTAYNLDLYESDFSNEVNSWNSQSQSGAGGGGGGCFITSSKTHTSHDSFLGEILKAIKAGIRQLPKRFSCSGG